MPAMQTSDASNFFRSENDLAAEDARAKKAERTKNIGHPIELKGKVIRLAVRDGEAWTAESGAVVRRTNLMTGKVVQVYKGHTGPVTCLAFFEPLPKSGRMLLLSGAWDQTIRAWDTETGALISTTNAHADFLKSLLVVPHLNLLVSGSSDKHIKLWDLTALSSPTTHAAPLVQIGSTTGHTRPVECLAHDPSAGDRVYSADSMGVVKAWDVESHPPPSTSRRLKLVADLKAHTMGVTDLWAAHGRVWSASTDDTVRVQNVEGAATPAQSQSQLSPPLLQHPAHVRSLLPIHLTAAALPILIAGAAGGALHVWDVEGKGGGDEENLSLIDGRGARVSGVVDVHSHDVCALALWVRNPALEKGLSAGKEGVTLEPVKNPEAWVVSGSLDGTLRRWKLTDLVDGKFNTADAEANPTEETPSQQAPAQKTNAFSISEEEERELAELLSDEDS
ncbi:WD40 repeat-like protein [Ceratobasidium sp. AG-I]|nr:WD40 repeat-like protein [Ceratobasidium sp. AG-I]